MTRGNLYFGWFSTDLWEESQRTEEFGIFIVKSVTADGSLLSPTGGKGNEPCTSYSRTIYNTKMATDGYDIACIFTHNNITLEHNAMNNKNTIAHMDVHNAQY